jgi:hypothetical protein
MRHFHLASINHRLVGLSLSLKKRPQRLSRKERYYTKRKKLFLFPLFRNGDWGPFICASPDALRRMQENDDCWWCMAQL